ncbi:MAG: CinA family protein [Lawsonella sp.]
MQAVQELSRHNLTVAAAESLTAGMFCATLAEVPGASAVLRGGLVVYATDLKAKLAGVAEQTLSTQGPVAEDTAAELAQGARLQCGADIGVGITGVAGPSEQNGVPVGTVFLGIDVANEPSTVVEYRFFGTRSEIRMLSVEKALLQVIDYCRKV